MNESIYLRKSKYLYYIDKMIYGRISVKRHSISEDDKMLPLKHMTKNGTLFSELFAARDAVHNIHL